MQFDSDIVLLSAKFHQDYPQNQYPEILYKPKRPYTCLLIDTCYDYYICVPFRSSIEHKNAYIFRETARSIKIKSKSGLDYSKILIINNSDYLDNTPAVIDQVEYVEMQRNISTIVAGAVKYVSTYINHAKGIVELHTSAFDRKYRYSTLPYFHKILGLPENFKDFGF